MARIPVVERRERIPGVVGTRGSVGAAGAEFGTLARGAEQFAAQQMDALERQRRAERANLITQTTAEATRSWARTLEEMQRTATDGAAGFTDQYLARTTQDIERFVGQTDDEETKAALRNTLTSLQTSYVGKAMSFQATERTQYRKDTLLESFEGYREGIYRNPDLYDEIDRQALAAIADARVDLGADEARDLRLKWKGLANVTRLQGLIARDPESALERLAPATRPNMAASQPVVGEVPESYYARLKSAESAGRADARNPRSTATGLYQFTEGTWRDVMRAHPELDLTSDGRTDPEQQERAIRAFTEDNRRVLVNELGRAPTVGELHLAHFLGAGGAAEVIQAPNETPAETLVSRGAVNANPEVLRGKTAGEIKAWAAGKQGGRQMASAEPSVMSDAVEADPMLAGIDPKTLESLTNRAERRVNERRSALRADLKGRIEDEITALRQGDDTVQPVPDSAIDAAFDPAEAAEVKATMRREREFGGFMSELAMASPERVAEIEQALRPEGEGFAEESERYALWRRALDADLKARADDPVAYLSRHSPELRDAITAAEESPEQMPQMFRTLDDLQARIGIPEMDRRLLSKDQASAIVKQFAGASPEDAANLVESLSEQFGAYWPRVYGELVQAKLPENARVLAALNRPAQAGARVALVEAMRTGRPDLKRVIGDQASKDIGEYVRAELGEFIASTSFAPGGASMAAGVVDTVELLAMQYARSMNPTEAARKAAKDVVNDYYTFQDGYRVPIEFDADSVRERSMLSLDALSPEILHPRGTLFPNVPEENLRQSAYDAALAGRWVTNHDETGLIRLNAMSQPVVLDDGSFLTVPFKAPEGFKPQPKVPSGDRPLLGQPPFVPGGSFLNLPPSVLNR